MSFRANHRLVENVPLEAEWSYLVNETLAGERCILPLLETLASDMRLPRSLRSLLQRQIEEEADHVARYEALFHGRRFASTGYDKEFSQFVRDIGPITLKLFSLQAILESISLGALTYRRDTLIDSPSEVDDIQILKDEEGHVRFGLAFLGLLKEIDGVIALGDFDEITHAANKIFARHFDGSNIAHFMDTNFAIKAVSASDIDRSAGMKIFKRTSTKTIIKIKNEFIHRYVNTKITQT